MNNTKRVLASLALAGAAALSMSGVAQADDDLLGGLPAVNSATGELGKAGLPVPGGTALLNGSTPIFNR